MASQPLRLFLTATALACTTLLAQAHNTDSKDPAQQHAEVTERLSTLKKQLNLSAEQENAWKQYHDVLQADERQSGSRQSKKDMSEAQKEESRKKREARKQEKSQARSVFREQLTPAQQQIFDKETSAHEAGKENKKRSK